jgi:hypothetical protein
MAHLVSSSLTDSLTSGPSASKITEVAAMQNFIQDLLGDTHHTFLQGSYRNDTARSDINDVDIVAVRLQTYSSIFSGKVFPSSIPWESIFNEIEQKLRGQRRYSSWTVTRGDKCIKVRGAFNADVVPAVQVGSHEEDPIVVYSFRTMVEKTNHPRLHYENGVTKNKATVDQYKPTVRMFKNWAYNHFGDDRDIFSSFKVEALVHGMPNEHFSEDAVTTFILGADGMVKKLSTRGLVPLIIPSVCGNEDITANWSVTGRTTFVNQLKRSLESALGAYKATSIAHADTQWRTAFNL